MSDAINNVDNAIGELRKQEFNAVLIDTIIAGQNHWTYYGGKDLSRVEKICDSIKNDIDNALKFMKKISIDKNVESTKQNWVDMRALLSSSDPKNRYVGGMEARGQLKEAMIYLNSVKDDLVQIRTEKNRSRQVQLPQDDTRLQLADQVANSLISAYEYLMNFKKIVELAETWDAEGGGGRRKSNRRKSNRKKSTRRKSTKKKSTKKKSTGRKSTRKKSTRKKSTRKKSTRMKK